MNQECWAKVKTNVPFCYLKYTVVCFGVLHYHNDITMLKTAFMLEGFVMCDTLQQMHTISVMNRISSLIINL